MSVNAQSFSVRLSLTCHLVVHTALRPLPLPSYLCVQLDPGLARVSQLVDDTAGRAEGLLETAAYAKVHPLYLRARAGLCCQAARFAYVELCVLVAAGGCFASFGGGGGAGGGRWVWAGCGLECGWEAGQGGQHWGMGWGGGLMWELCGVHWDLGADLKEAANTKGSS